MTKLYSSLLSLFMIFCLSGLTAQDTLWIEDFTPYADTTGVIGSETGPVNGGDYPDGVTKWTLDASNATLGNTSDYAMVRTVNEEKLFDWRDVEGGVIMTTETIDISSVDTALFSIEFVDDGDFESSDYIDVSYSINGGAFTLITNYAGVGNPDHTIIGDIPDDDDWIAVTIFQEGLIGNSLAIKIEVASNSGSEFVKMDNITVRNASGFVLDPCLNTNITVTGVVSNESEDGENDGEIDISIIGGQAPFDALWSDGSTDGDREDLMPGPYTVTVTDTFGCTGTASFEVLPGPTALEGDTVWCEDFESYADSTGFIGDTLGNTVTIGDYPASVTKWTIDASGTDFDNEFDHFMVRNLGSTEQPNQVLDARDTGGPAEWTSESIDISGYDEIGFLMTIEDDGDHEAADYVDVSYSIDGGDFTLVENWNGLGSSTHTLVGDIPDDDDWLFTVVQVTELSGSTLQLKIELSNNSGTEFIKIDNICVIGDDLGPDPCDTVEITISGVVTDESVLGAGDGAVDITVGGNGTPAYTYFWTNGSTDEDVSGLNPGPFIVTVTDQNGCTGSETFTVEAGTNPCDGIDISATATITDETVLGAEDGALDITVTGNGTGPYTFSWSNGSTDEDISALAAGDYTVTITDANGCTGTAMFTVAPGADPCAGVTITINGTVTDESAAGAGDGAIDITVSGGTAGYTFSWSNSSTSEDISGLDPASYTVVVTDAAGCSDEATFTVAAGPSAVNEIASLKVFDVYPNPATEQFNIQLQLDRAEEIQLFIINPIGSVVYESGLERIQSKTYTIQNEWSSGIYFLEIRSADGVAVKQLILLD